MDQSRNRENEEHFLVAELSVVPGWILVLTPRSSAGGFQAIPTCGWVRSMEVMTLIRE